MIKVIFWRKNKEILFDFCNEYQRTPDLNEKYKELNIGKWLIYQKMCIGNKNDYIYQNLSENKYVKNYLDNHFKKIKNN